MLLALSLALLLGANHDNAAGIELLDGMAQRKDVAGLTKLLTPLPEGIRNPFKVLGTGGAYDVGRFGWHAGELLSADGKQTYVVIYTPLTSEDVGEILLKRSGAQLKFVPEADPLGAHIAHHHFDLRFDVPNKKAFIEDRMSMRYDTAAPSTVIFRMSPCYIVRSIEGPGGKAIPFRETGGVVSMRRGPGAKDEITVRYDAVVDLPQYAASISSAEATLVNDYWYPMIARQPSPYEVTIHAPRDWTSVAQGERLSDETTPNERITKYRMDLPIVYFSLISAPFKSRAEVIGGRTFTTWSARLTEDQLDIQDELYGTIFNYYSSIFGAPPYPFYGCVDSKTYGGGALEAYTFATWGGGGLPMEDAHEPSHTWWGGIVNNTYLSSFWNESFAVFSDGLYHRNVPIGNHAERRLAFIQDGNSQADFGQIAMSESGADVGGVGSSLGYGKGGKVLQMLEQWIGTDRMIESMRTWATTQPKGVPGDWADFERIVSRLNPTVDIKGFFADWVHRPGFADFDAKAQWTAGIVKVRLNWKSARFRMPLTVMLQSPTGARSFETVFLNGKSDEILIPSPEKPVFVSIDPWRQAVRPISGDERPLGLAGTLGEMKKIVDPSHTDWLTRVGGSGEAASSISDPAGLFIVGTPETLPAMIPLCAKAGFIVHGDRLTYDGTTIDLNHGAAVAIVDLGGGKRCAIGLGKTRMPPDFGRARLILTDDLGRFVRGVTEPKTSGKLTYRL